MSRVLSDEDIEAIAQRLTAFSGLSSQEHKDHHEAISLWIERQNKRAAFWEKVEQQVGGWLIISLLSAIGYGVWHTFFDKGG